MSAKQKEAASKTAKAYNSGEINRCPCDECVAGRAGSRPRTAAERLDNLKRNWAARKEKMG